MHAHGVVADVVEAGEVERFVEEAAAALGGLDMAVANVGGASDGELLASSPEDWVRTFDLNLFHAVRTIRASVPHMGRRGGGSAVTISSISGWKPAPRAQYGAAKAGEIFLAGALEWELAPHRIRVNTVSPGSIMFSGGGWDRFRSTRPDRFAEFERREFSWGRLGRPEEVADVVVFLLSERAAWVNGAHIAVEGAQGRRPPSDLADFVGETSGRRAHHSADPGPERGARGFTAGHELAASTTWMDQGVQR